MTDENLMLVTGAVGNVIPDVGAVFISDKGGLPATQTVKPVPVGKRGLMRPSTNIGGDSWHECK